MKFIVSAYTTDTNTGSMSEDDRWEFDNLEEAQEAFDEMDVEYSFRCELECGHRANMKHVTHCCELLEEEEDGFYTTIDYKEATLASIED